MNWGIKLGWALDGCAGWLKVTIINTMNFSCYDFQMNLQSCGLTIGWGLDACARWRKVTLTIALKLYWVVIFKII